VQHGVRRPSGVIARWVLWLGVLATPAWGQPASVSGDDPSKPKLPTCMGTVDVHAVDRVTHEALAGALIRIDGAVVGDTDAAGRAALTGICAGFFTGTAVNGRPATNRPLH
jgi:hypothetical protein